MAFFGYLFLISSLISPKFTLPFCYNHHKRMVIFIFTRKNRMYNSSLPLCRVALSAVIPPDIAADATSVARLAASIRSVGLLCLLILYKCRRKYSIIDGNHRYLALKMLNAPCLDALIVTDDQTLDLLPSKPQIDPPAKPEPLILIRDIRPLYNALSRMIDRMNTSGIPSNVSCETFDDKTTIKIEIEKPDGVFHVKHK